MNKKNKKSTFLMICIISLTFLVISTMTIFGQRQSYRNTSYINKDKWNFIEPNFYKSSQFDSSVLQPIINGLQMELYGKTNAENFYYYDDISSMPNIRYIAVDKLSNKYITNTSFKTVDDFRKSVDGYVDISFNSRDGIYTKQIGNEKSEINMNNYNNNNSSIPYINSNLEAYVSFPKNLQPDGTIYYEYRHYNKEINALKIWNIILITSLITSIVSMLLYRKNKYEEIENSFFKIYNKIPVDVGLIGIYLLTIFTINWTSYGYNDLSLILMSIVAMLVVISYIAYIIEKLKNENKKINILKYSLIYKIMDNVRYTIIESLKASKKVTLIKKIIYIGIGCIVINILGVMVLDFVGAIIVPPLTMICFTAYILKKLAYTSEIMDGAEKIKSGNLNYKIPLRDDDHFTALAENINNIGQGLENSIEEALKSERLKAELITNVSHDLKTPLTSIINYIQLIKKEENIQPEYINDYVKVLDSKSKRLKILIEDLFEASKASSGNIELNMEKIEFRQLLRQSIGEMEEKLLESKLDIKLNLPDEKVYIYADGRRMYRVLENLISNIIKYSLVGTRVYIDMSVNDESVLLTMKNISSYELNFDPVEIMERFKRADESRNTEGSGLGLAIAKDLINLQGGKFKIEIDGDLFKSILEFDEIK